MIWIPCDANCEPKNQYVCRDEERAHEFDYEEVCEGPDRIVESIVYAKCCNCGNLSIFLGEEWVEAGKEMELRAARTGRANLTRYPRIEPHTGALVQSRDDETRAMKAMGMHAAPNGIDERYDDESCHILREKRQKLEQRKVEIARRRKALGRPRRA